MRSYDLGDVVILTAAFTVQGTPAAPDTVTIRIRAPSGAITTLFPGVSSAGVYTDEFVPSESGRHYYRVEGTGAAQAAEEASFIVRPSVF